MAAMTAFREGYVSADMMDDASYSSIEARKFRYEMYWAFYESTAYRDIHRWAAKYRTAYGMYKYARNLYNPSYRIGEFWKSMIFGGALDDELLTGAIPIETDNDKLRESIARVYKYSNWMVNKDVFTLRGAILGDVGIKIIDDPEKKIVRFHVINPAWLKSVDIDDIGYVKAYEIERPEIVDGKKVLYRETAERPGGDEVLYKTYLDNKPHDWGTGAAEWSENYGFVPLVMLQHNNVGMDWGWSELHPIIQKIREVDDIASKLSDQIRKTVESPWLLSGVESPRSSLQRGQTSATDQKPEPTREEVPMLYAPAGATATPLVAQLDINGTLTHIQGIMDEMERDYPELQMDIWSADGATSGRALRIARQRVESKIEQRRAVYESALIRANQMAVAIGGHQGYPGFEGFDLTSYRKGNLDHTIAERQAFKEDPQDKIEIEKTLWETASIAKETIPVETFLRRNGFTEDDLEEIGTQRLAEIKLAQEDIVDGIKQ